MRKVPQGSPVRERVRPSVRPDDGNAFVPDTIGQTRPLPAADAESFAEEFIGSATGGESVREDASDEIVADEDGGPFIVLDEDARLPGDPEERNSDREDDEPMQNEAAYRGARWAAKGL